MSIVALRSIVHSFTRPELFNHKKWWNSSNLVPIMNYSRIFLSQNIITRKFSDLSKGDFPDVPGVKAEGEKFILVFTCKKCDVRSAKKISKQAYYNGCCVARCPGCKSMHLISDHLGIFETPGWDIQKYLSEQGDNVKVFNEDNILELTHDDIAPGIVPTNR
eukprot:gene15064-31954_t